jgi:hypothetical protein
MPLAAAELLVRGAAAWDRSAMQEIAAHQAALENAVAHLMVAEGPALVPVPQARSAMLSLAARLAALESVPETLMDVEEPAKQDLIAPQTSIALAEAASAIP